MPCGPGYRSPAEAAKAPPEEILYVVCISPDPTKHDYLAVVDVNPSSPTYSQVIHRLMMLNPGDELHHFGWNACSSCHESVGVKRDRLVLPCLGSDRVYIVDTSDPPHPKILKVIEPEKMHSLGVGTPHTTHCLPNGQVMISTMGDPEGNPTGDFLLLDSSSWDFSGLWTVGKKADFGYDFWYQPYWDVMVSTEWAAPKSFKQGFHPTLDPKIAGRSLNIFSWKERKLVKSINLGVQGIFPLEIRFLHDPKAPIGFVGSAYDSNIYRIFRKEDGEWDAEVVVHVPKRKVKGWKLHEMSGSMTSLTPRIQNWSGNYLLEAFLQKILQFLWMTQLWKGSVLLKINVDNEKGGLTLDKEFIVHFGREPQGPMLAHECRYPGGDCTSDIFVAEDD